MWKISWLTFLRQNISIESTNVSAEWRRSHVCSYHYCIHQYHQHHCSKAQYFHLYKVTVHSKVCGQPYFPQIITEAWQTLIFFLRVNFRLSLGRWTESVGRVFVCGGFPFDSWAIGMFCTQNSQWKLRNPTRNQLEVRVTLPWPAPARKKKKMTLSVL